MNTKININKTAVKKAAIICTVSLALVASAVGFVYYFGEAVAFAVTNRDQVLMEKAEWSAYVGQYGVVESPKAE